MQIISKSGFQIYCCEYEGEVRDLLVNKHREYRILYDRLLDKYFVAEAYNCIHLNIFETLWENYYYENSPLKRAFNLTSSQYFENARKEIQVKNINGEKRQILSGLLSKDDVIEPILYIIMFYPGDMSSGGQYEKKYKYSFGTLLAEYDITEKVRLANYLNKYDNNIKKESK